MIGGALLLVGLSWAGGIPNSSPPGVPAPGECPQSFAFVAGQPVAPEIVNGQCIARCGGVVVPTSDTAYLLRIEAESAMHLADIEALKAQRADLRAQLRETGHPWVHRLVGGVVGVTLGVGMGLTLAAYYTGTGGE